MITVIAMAGALWGIGALMGAPRSLRWGMIAALWAAVVLMHLVLPQGAALRMQTGGSVAPWLLLGGFGVLVAGYGRVIAALKARARGADTDAVDKPLFSQTELERYARHIVLRELGGQGQRALKEARVLVIGAGGLGSPALMYLAAAGVGTIGVIDADVVENSNLQRQVIHPDANIDMPKVFSAQRAMQAQNPFITVRPYQRRFDEGFAETLGEYDLILDGTDNFETRYAANRMAVAAGIPLISGALSQWEGQLSVFDPQSGGPCYQCIFPEAPAAGLAPSCAEAGVAAPLPGVIGAMMAMEAVKVITGAGSALRAQMLIYDALYGESRKIALKPCGDCPVCGGKGSGNS
ncbi:molybdopterin-synthase adenylyltransferase MoeB [Litorivita sp. NS0012-18]|uniref:HesA/MoeB/ThiF family protein n=1 Tax=Litorivita sp. NS0012-18 TaxID=3127655 RepID=UPI0031046B53